jgi:alkanesulfonate monooxygenase SsuD/methylene tetrahydromethanopterin reductase-like flavin-dependent oxidoreductase (luciferase family)
MTGSISLGLMGSVDPGLIRALAPRLEAAGFHSLWLNDSGGGDTFAGLAAAAEATSTLVLATGVLPFDRRPAVDIAAAVEKHQLPVDRLVLGVGSGASRTPLELVAQGIADLRGLTDAPIVLGALGPKMRGLGAREANGLLLSWLTPGAAADAVGDARREAQSIGRTSPRAVLYARAAVDPAAKARLDTESATYSSYPAYAANFARLGIAASDTTVGPRDVASDLDAYLAVVDELVLRAITPTGSLDDYLRFVEHADIAARLAA